MSKVANIFAVTVIAGLVACPVYANGGGAFYVTDDASYKVSGAKCDTDKEDGLEADIFFIHDVGPDSGTVQSNYFLEDDAADEAPFITHSKMRRHEIGVTFGAYNVLVGDLVEFGEGFCEDFVEIDEIELTTSGATINKKGTKANVVFKGKAAWLNSDDKERTIRFIKKGKLELNGET